MRLGKLPRQYVAAVLIALLIGVLFLTGNLSSPLLFVFIIIIAVLIMTGSREKEEITLNQAIEVARDELIRMQKRQELEQGSLRFMNEAKPSRDREGFIVEYNLMFEVEGEQSQYYYIKVGIYGSFLGISKLRRGKSIFEVEEDEKLKPYKSTQAPKEEPAVRTEEGTHP